MDRYYANRAVFSLSMLLLVAAAFVLSNTARCASAQELAADKSNLESYQLPKLNVGKYDWPQWGGSSLRNNTPVGSNIPTEWDVETGKNIKWSANLGSQTFSSPVVANGKIYVGTNNGAGYLARYPSTVDLGCLLCLDETTGEFLWQHSNEKLASGRFNDYPYYGVLSVPFVDGDRLWYVTNRGEVVCLDTEGFRDSENDGSFQNEAVVAENEADVVWKFDMMAELGTRQHEFCPCSVTCAGDKVFVVTANGVDISHLNVPAPQAAAFVTLDRNTGKVLWTDNAASANVMHASWSSPTYAVLGGRPQVLFPGGDGWLYSFDPAGDGQGKAKLLWKFDCNLKNSTYTPGGHGGRNERITVPVVYDQRVYVATGADPEHGYGVGHLWCIDPAKSLTGSDVSPTLVYDAAGKIVAPRRVRAFDPKAGEYEKPNPDSAAIWHKTTIDRDGDGRIGADEGFGRTMSPPAIQDDLLLIADFRGVVHCLDARTGKTHWTHDVEASVRSGSLIVDRKVYVADEDGDVAIFALSADKRFINEVFMSKLGIGQAVYSTPIVANNVLYIATKSKLYAIAQ